jgi:hypothetical protein
MAETIEHKERSEKVVTRPTFTVAQIVQGVAGIILTVSGILVLVRTGLVFDPPGQAEVLGFVQTTWLAVINIVLGIMALVGATTARDRSLGIFTGLVMVVLGIVLVAEPNAFDSRLVAGDTDTGWLYVALGGIVLAACAFAPTVYRQARASEKADEEHNL